MKEKQKKKTEEENLYKTIYRVYIIRYIQILFCVCLTGEVPCGGERRGF